MTYQVSIFLENKLGRPENMPAVLKQARINVRSINLTVRRMAGAYWIWWFRIRNAPGGLDDLIKSIARTGVNVTESYGRVVDDGDSAFFAIDIQDLPGARIKRGLSDSKSLLIRWNTEWSRFASGS